MENMDASLKDKMKIHRYVKTLQKSNIQLIGALKMFLDNPVIYKVSDKQDLTDEMQFAKRMISKAEDLLTIMLKKDREA
jgi:hypothetical protein